MRRSEAKEGVVIISQNGFEWRIVKRYSKTFLLIKPISEAIEHMKCCSLSGGQFRMFKVKVGA